MSKHLENFREALVFAEECDALNPAITRDAVKLVADFLRDNAADVAAFDTAPYTDNNAIHTEGSAAFHFAIAITFADDDAFDGFPSLAEYAARIKEQYA